MDAVGTIDDFNQEVIIHTTLIILW